MIVISRDKAHRNEPGMISRDEHNRIIDKLREKWFDRCYELQERVNKLELLIKGIDDGQEDFNGSAEVYSRQVEIYREWCKNERR